MDRHLAAAALAAERVAIDQQRAALDADLASITAAAADSNLDDEHDPEGSTIAFEREQLAALRAQARQRLAEVDAALGRLAENRYGYCENCGQPVGAERLTARPATRFCVRCAAARR